MSATFKGIVIKKRKDGRVHVMEQHRWFSKKLYTFKSKSAARRWFKKRS